MRDEPSRSTWWPLAVAFGLAAVVHLGLLVTWGDPEPLHDELGYLHTGQLVAAQLRDGGDPSVLGRLAWHNAGYSALFVAAELTFGDARLPLRLLQVLAGLLAGLLVFHGLRLRVSRRWALLGALVVWLHPSMLFFRLSFWPVALAVLGTSAAALCALRLADAPEQRGRQWELGLALAPLPFFAPQALALIPGLLIWPGPRCAPRVLGPLLALWIPWMIATSVALGTFTPIDLAGPSNLALGNHPAIAEGRGSLWGDPVGKARLQADLDAACPAAGQADTIRCEAAESVRIARSTLASQPVDALRRAGLRLLETWAPDRFLLRRLDELGQTPPPGLPELLLLLHLALLAAALVGLSTPVGRAAAFAALLWCVPVLLTVGFTRLRQPLLPWLVMAGIAGLAALLTSRPNAERRDP